MKIWNRVLPLAFMVLLLGGCGKSAATMSTIAIQKDGTIEHTMIEDFGEASVDALQDMMLEKAAAYNNSNAGGEDGVTVKEIEAEDGVVRVVMTYPDAASFDGFMNMDVVEVDPALRAPFFYGTVEDAYMQGLDLEIKLQSADGGNVLRGKDDILSMGKNKIIIYDSVMNLGAPVQISMPDKPLYVSDNVTVTGKKVVEISGTDKLAYILLEK